VRRTHSLFRKGYMLYDLILICRPCDCFYPRGASIGHRTKGGWLGKRERMRVRLRILSQAGITLLVFTAGQPARAGTLTIVPTFDGTIAGASDASQIEAVIDTAIGTIDGLYTTFVSVTDSVYFQLGSGSFSRIPIPAFTARHMPRTPRPSRPIPRPILVIPCLRPPLPIYQEEMTRAAPLI
jgi:hypothetical protein